jgi:hypothetical protein
MMYPIAAHLWLPIITPAGLICNLRTGVARIGASLGKFTVIPSAVLVGFYLKR